MQRISGAGPTGARIDEYLTRLVPLGFSGGALAAVGSEVVLLKGYGLADREHRVPVTTDTVFDIGSISKQFTSAAILHLEMQGKLATSDPISKHLEGVPEDKVDITLHHLLTHTSGIPDLYGGDFDEIHRDEAVAKILGYTLISRPGERYAYSNPGYILLAAIVEQVSGQPFQQYLSVHLFKPAGMESTGFYGDVRWTPERTAHGYVDGDDQGSPARWPGPYWWLLGAGGVVSNVGDLYKWVTALTGDAILSAETKVKLYAPFQSGYAYGWQVSESERGTKIIEHNGANDFGFSADLRHFVDESALLALTFNTTFHGAFFIYVLSDVIAGMLFGEEPPLPPVAVELEPDTLRQVAGRYTTLTQGAQGGTLEVRIEDGRLLAVPQGQEAVDILFAPDRVDTARHQDLTALATKVIDGIVRNDFEPLREALANKPRFEIVRGAIAEWLRSWTDTNGPLEGYGGPLTRPGWEPWPENMLTYVPLHFRKRDEVIRFVWNQAGLIATGRSPGVGRLVSNLLPQSEGRFIAFDLFSSVSVPVTFRRSGGKALLIAETARGDVTLTEVEGRESVARSD